MPGRGVSRAQANRKIRQDALREQIANQGHESYAFEILKKFNDLGEELDQLTLTRLKYAFEGHIAFMKKYIPDVRSMEITAEVHHVEHEDWLQQHWTEPEQESETTSPHTH